MEIGLCMVVKDEGAQLSACLEPIAEFFAQIVVVDTGSTDDTAAILQEMGITPVNAQLQAERCYCLQDPRKTGLRQLTTPWVMFLDADERIDPASLHYLRNLPDRPGVAGYFGTWLNHPANGPQFNDYKLFLFRHGLEPVGLVHDNVQLDIRRRGARAEWLDELVVEHFPVAARTPHKKSFYRQRLLCAIAREPNFLRYYWFLGYMDFLEGNHGKAESLLRRTALSRSRTFPVECLNSTMVLAAIYTRTGRESQAEGLLSHGLEFYDSVRDDFEVAINRDLEAWLNTALQQCRGGDAHRITPPRFAC